MSRSLEDVNIPPADFKGIKKKHTDLGDFEWLNICGQAIEVIDFFKIFTVPSHVLITAR